MLKRKRLEREWNENRMAVEVASPLIDCQLLQAIRVSGLTHSLTLRIIIIIINTPEYGLNSEAVSAILVPRLLGTFRLHLAGPIIVTHT